MTRIRKGTRGGLYAPEEKAPDKRAAARAIYEGTPGSTVATVAKEIGIPEGTLKRWKAEDMHAGNNWRPAHLKVPDLVGRAAELANSFRIKMTELGKPMTDEVAVQEATKEIATQHAVNVRAQVLDRHRKEWAAPRRLAYDAMQKATGKEKDVAGAFEMARLAKIASETLQIIQVGECRAFGLDHAARGADGGTVVLIEREAPTADSVMPPKELENMGNAVPADPGSEETF